MLKLFTGKRSLPGLIVFLILICLIGFTFFLVPKEASLPSSELSPWSHPWIKPEPIEAIYFSIIVSLMTLTGGALLFFRDRFKPIQDIRTIHWGEMVVEGLLVLFILNSDIFAQCFPSGPGWLSLLAAMFAFLIVLFPRESEKFSFIIRLVAVIVFLIIVFSFRVQSLEDLTNAPWWTDHFQTLFHSIESMASGRRAEGDFIPQYGFNAVYLQYALLKNVDPIFTLTLVLSSLFVLSLLLIYRSGAGLMKSSIVKTFFLTALAVLIGFHYKAAAGIFLDPYYQYFPLRLLAPALGFFLICSWSSNIKVPAWRSVGSGLLLGFLPTFNLDSGLPTLVICLIILAAITFRDHSRIREAILIVGGAFVYLLIFCLIIRPPLTDIFTYQSAYFSYGMAMLPAPRNFHLWHIVLATYIWNMIWNFRQKTSEVQFYSRFYLSLIGLSLFLYYAGRSHDENLIACFWPFVVIVFLYFDRLYTFDSTSEVVTLRWILLIPSVFLLIQLFFCVPYVFKRLSSPPLAAVFKKNAKRFLTQSRECELVSGVGGVYHHLGLARMDWAGPSISEQIFLPAQERYLKFLRSRKCLLVDKLSLGQFVAGRALLSELNEMSTPKIYLD